MSPGPPQPYLRASDADREAAVERLHRASVEGRIDADELEERLDAAYAARWTSDLDRLTADLVPRPVHPVRAPMPAPLAYPPLPAPAKTTNGMAVASLVASVVWFAWLGSIFGVIFGHVALYQIKRSTTPQNGYGLAVAGLAIGYLALALLLVKLAVPG